MALWYRVHYKCVNKNRSGRTCGAEDSSLELHGNPPFPMLNCAICKGVGTMQMVRQEEPFESSGAGEGYRVSAGELAQQLELQLEHGEQQAEQAK